LNSLSTQPVVEFMGSHGWKRGIATFVILAGLAACAAVQPATPEQAVKQRAQEKWTALVKGDLKAAYALFSPGSKAVNTLENFSGSVRQGFWKAATVDAVACSSAQSCEVTLSIEYDFQGKRVKTPLRETWIREGSDWWYVHK
jgi:hypothetical protein